MNNVLKFDRSYAKLITRNENPHQRQTTGHFSHTEQVRAFRALFAES